MQALSDGKVLESKYTLQDLVVAAAEFKYWIDIQPPGRVRSYGREPILVSESGLYRKACDVLAFFERFSDPYYSYLCPLHMLLREVFVCDPNCCGRPKGIINPADVFEHVRLCLTDQELETLNLIRDRLKKKFSLCLVTDKANAVEQGIDLVERDQDGFFCSGHSMTPSGDGNE